MRIKFNTRHTLVPMQARTCAPFSTSAMSKRKNAKMPESENSFSLILLPNSFHFKKKNVL